MINKALVELERKEQVFQQNAKKSKIKWMKTRNKMTHLIPKKKKRK